MQTIHTEWFTVAVAYSSAAWTGWGLGNKNVKDRLVRRLLRGGKQVQDLFAVTSILAGGVKLQIGVGYTRGGQLRCRGTCEFCGLR